MAAAREDVPAAAHAESIIDYLSVPSPPPIGEPADGERFPFPWGDDDGWE